MEFATVGPLMKGATQTQVRPLGDAVNDRSKRDVSTLTRRPLDRFERWLIALETLVSLAGLSGGVFMSTHPLTMMPLKYLQGTLFHTWRWPGLALFFFVGVCTAFAVMATLQRRRSALLGHFGVGMGLVA